MKKKKRRDKGEVVEPFPDKDGFLCVVLEKAGDRVVKRVHELVALTFLPNPHNLPEVRHKNGDITDNRAENLEWCSREDNTDKRKG